MPAGIYLIIVGALPPPRGGVTTHVERLLPYLKEEGIGYVIWDYSRCKKEGEQVVLLRNEPFRLVRSLWQRPGKAVSHCLLSKVSMSRLLFCALLKMTGIRLTITIVGSPKEIINEEYLKLRYSLTLARLASEIIVVNRDFQKVLVDNGIPAKKVSNIPAFVPFKENGFKERPIPKGMVDFCLGHGPLVLTYAYGPLFHANEDLYGLDLFVALAHALRKEFPAAGFVAVIPEISNETYMKDIRGDVEGKGLGARFLFAIGNHFSFVPFLEYADIFVRATNTDGDALTLREALHYGVPSVASDVCYRPEGTILFRNRDIEDLSKVARQVLRGRGKDACESRQQGRNNAELFIEVFKRAAGVRNQGI